MFTLNTNLKDLLMREAHLRLYRERLEPLWEKKEADLRAVEAARPFFIPVISRRKREEYEARLAEARAAVLELRKGKNMIDQVAPKVEKMIEERLEVDLQVESGAERRAAAAKASWQDTGNVRGRTLAAWARLRAEVAPQIFAGDTEHVTAETVRMILPQAHPETIGQH